MMNTNIPEFLYEKLQSQYGTELCNKILAGYSKDRLTTLRVNTLKSNYNEIKSAFEKMSISFQSVPWNKNAFILNTVDIYDLTKTKMYENGEIYLQSLSSMIPPIILSPNKEENILDMAAAPGGKTTQMAALSNNEAFITACEKNQIRAKRLKYNLNKQGAGRVSVIQEDARNLDDFFSFDKILLDAPCSGSGTIQIRDKNLYNFFTKELIERSIKTQKQLLYKASKILKKDGEIIYSTCSILKEENENVLSGVLAKTNLEIVPIDIDYFTNIPMLPTTIKGTMCICPTELYEGFFVARLKKII